MYETKVDCEHEQDATEEEDVPEVEHSVQEDEPAEDTAQDESDSEDSEVRSAAEAAFFAGWRAKHKTANIRKARGFQELSLSPNPNSSGSRSWCCSR